MTTHTVWDHIAFELASLRVLRNEPLSLHTSFRVGGSVPCYVIPHSEKELCHAWEVCHQNGVEVRILGKGSNVLVSDAGINCVVIQCEENLSSLHIDGTTLTVEAGASNAFVAEAACEAGLSGYEFAAGIPGTVGGAAIMNAGAYGGEFKDVAKSVRCLTPDGTIKTLTARDADWGYRQSMIDKKGWVVLAVTLLLSPGKQSDIRARMDDLHSRRAAKQPLDVPSAGSTFKRPKGYFAGTLIQQAGLVGARIGGAQVSCKHAGFIVNNNNARAADIYRLIVKVQQTVFAHFQVHLTPEVRLWGFDSSEIHLIDNPQSVMLDD